MQSLNPDLSTSPKEKIPRIRVIQRFFSFLIFFWTLGTYLAKCTGLDLNDEEEDGRMRGGRERLSSLGSGWFRFREWFVFALDGLLEALVWSVWLVWSVLVWFGLVWLYSRLGEELLLVLFLSGCLFVSCCILYTACCTRSVLSLRF